MHSTNILPWCAWFLQVIKLISQVIADFANGEISQIGSLFDTGLTLKQYSDKSFYKTATLIAASCKSAAVFSGVSQEVKESMFEYGRHLGLAFQVVDDILDFTQTAEQLGKPQVGTSPFFTSSNLCRHLSLVPELCVVGIPGQAALSLVSHAKIRKLP